jgi:hypothetical protein
MMRAIIALAITGLLLIAAKAQFVQPPYYMLLPAPSAGGCAAGNQLDFSDATGCNLIWAGH